jgi:hypothetical protein
MTKQEVLKMIFKNVQKHYADSDIKVNFIEDYYEDKLGLALKLDNKLVMVFRLAEKDEEVTDDELVDKYFAIVTKLITKSISCIISGIEYTPVELEKAFNYNGKMSFDEFKRTLE